MNPERYLDLFISESRDHVGAAWACLSRLAADPSADVTRAASRELMRHAHSLKGMAAMMGYEALAGLAHALEDVFETLAAGGLARDAGTHELLRDGLACIGSGVDAIERRDAWSDRPAREIAAALRRLEPESTPAAPAASPAADGAPADPPAGSRCRVDLRVAPSDDEVPALLAVLRGVASLGTIERVDPPRAGVPGDPRRLGLELSSALDPPSLRDRVAALPGTSEVAVTPLPGARRPVAPDTPERLVRVRCALLDDLLERTVDLILEQGRARTAIAAGGSSDDGAGGHLDRAGAIVRDLYATVTELRLVPFDDEADRLHRTVHEVARTLGRPVRFAVAGGSTRIDRAMLDALVDPIAHALRNALDHGVEDAAAREAAGKPATARIDVRVARSRGWVRIEVADDGRGIDPAAVRRRAVTTGLVTESAAAALDDRAARLLVTEPGISTASAVTPVSGRGVGLDVVREAVERLGGRLEIDSTVGAGATIRMLLPTDVTLVRALLVRGVSDLFAVPLSGVVRAAAPTPATVWLDASIAASCGAPVPATAAPPSAALVVERPDGPLEVGVSEIVGRRRVVVRPLHAPLERLQCYAGAALLDDGRIALVVDPFRL